jgi:hypothetical protein
MIHLARRRNMNEYCGAYGYDFTFDEMKWLTNWLIVRGCNMLVPHAFYYSVRGPRIDERPPDVGPNSPWWRQYKPFADACSRLSWLNTDSKHICTLAILGLNDYLPWQAAKVCFQNQRDFNYLEARHLWEDAEVGPNGIQIEGMHYEALVVEFDPLLKAKASLKVLERRGSVRNVEYRTIERRTSKFYLQNSLFNVQCSSLAPAMPDLRVRHVVKNQVHFYIVFNEGQEQITFLLTTSVKGRRLLLNPETGQSHAIDPDELLKLRPHELYVLMVVES